MRSASTARECAVGRQPAADPGPCRASLTLSHAVTDGAGGGSSSRTTTASTRSRTRSSRTPPRQSASTQRVRCGARRCRGLRRGRARERRAPLSDRGGGATRPGRMRGPAVRHPRSAARRHGAELWTPNGVRCAARQTARCSAPLIPTARAGRSWRGATSARASTTFAQRVNSSGAAQWTADGHRSRRERRAVRGHRGRRRSRRHDPELDR